MNAVIKDSKRFNNIESVTQQWRNPHHQSLVPATASFMAPFMHPHLKTILMAPTHSFIKQVVATYVRI